MAFYHEYSTDDEVWPVVDVVALEQSLAAEGTPLLELMRRAGAALAQVAREAVASRANATVNGEGDTPTCVILAGTGNNGGDGWVAGSLLARDGWNVVLVTKVEPEEITAEPARSAISENTNIWQASDNFEIVVSPSAYELAVRIASADVVIDAILGTGFTHDEVHMPYSTWIKACNSTQGESHHPFVIAADCPSGLNAQTGIAAATCIKADETVTMLKAKTGLTSPSAKTYVGKLLVAPLVG
jgi:NAD(P)H-hydrate epimerase